MTIESVVQAWGAAWDARDGAAAAALLAADGTFEDPVSGGAVGRASVPDSVEALARAFPDARFARVPVVAGARGVIEWVMEGTHLGTWQGGPATGRTVRLEGVDVLEGDAAGLRRVRRYFDPTALAEQLGWVTLVQPESVGRARYGYSMRVASGNPRPPGVIALTWIEAADQGEKDRIRAHSRQNVDDFLQEPGFIAIVTGFTGLRGFTVTAWEDEGAMRRALGKHHAVAMEELFGERFVAAVWTSVWQATRMNRIWVRCRECGSLQDVNDDHRTCTACAAGLPERPAFW
ncbi:hypothetical protein TBR22_A14640 [Luteitalea sp. TBR-22]|uniref:ester cyclase n=1 Tax=Luteitalea sp. TBR-22 TaxID=2802971 RepID=UPI001AF28FBE|nr:ester cyclase [Luteitalea sp. TBR-22]BCS32254.1 hypothetical protein TBR22_A14640 [Luteitalea sp. TBR-22]